MKLRLSLLQRMIDLPSGDPIEVRRTLDDLGLEVKNVETIGTDTQYTIETLANRGDHVSALGIAREFSARLLTAVNTPAMSGELPAKRPSVPVRVNTPKCLRYALLEMTLPSGMKLRPDIAQYVEPNPERHAVVDTLNYMLTEIGQPMHAFDREKVEGEILIDTLSAPETIVALDGNSYTVPAESIVIRDKSKIIAVAGVIGCANSMVTPGTTRIAVESALFDPVSVRITKRAMGLATDASFAFERGCDYDMVVTALKRFMHLTAAPGGQSGENAGAHPVGYMVIDGEGAPKRQIPLRIANVRRHLNLPRLAEAEITARLKYLGFSLSAVSGEKESYTVTVPTWRIWDVVNESCLVEEAMRSIGINKVKLELPALDYETPERNEVELLRERIDPRLHGQGFLEVITKSFYTGRDVALLERLNPGTAASHITMRNSIETSYSHLKLTNILHLAQLAEHNLRRGVQSVKVYEIGRLFTAHSDPKAPYEYEREVLTLAASGRWAAHEWRQPESREECLSQFKGVLEGIVAAIGRSLTVAESEDPYLHPGIQGKLKAGRSILGVFGLIHPEIKAHADMKHDLLYAELSVEALCALMQRTTYDELADLPSIRRDITLKVEPRSLAERVTRSIEEMKPENLRDIAILDDFKRPEEAFRRVTFRITFQRADRTLTHPEVDAVMSQLLAGLKDRTGVELA